MKSSLDSPLIFLLPTKHLHLISGAITIFLHVPFHRTPKESLSSWDEELLEGIYERSSESFQAARRASEDGAGPPFDLAKLREFELGGSELPLLTRVLGQVIEEHKEFWSPNVYFNGDEFGVTRQDFETLFCTLEDSQLDESSAPQAPSTRS